MGLTDIGFRVCKYSDTRHTSELKVATYVACHISVKTVPIRTAGMECLLLLFRSLFFRVVRPGMITTSDEQLLAIDIRNPSVLLPVGTVNHGVTFMMALDGARMESIAERNMKSRCLDFLVEARKQVQQRLPANIQVWKSMTVFSPTAILSQTKPQLTSVSVLKLYSGDLAALETKYQAVTYQPWTNQEDSQAQVFRYKV